jgi:putative DNA primase/helicase
MSTGSATSADFDSWVARAREVRIEEELSRRSIKLTGKNGRLAGPCPVCGGTDRFSINVAKQLFNCRICGKGGKGAIDLVKFLDGVDFIPAVETLTGDRRRDPGVVKPVESTEASTTERRQQDGRGIWSEAQHPAGTPVDAYLANRPGGLILPPHCDAIRFHPRCPFGKDDNGHTIYTPAMIALVRNIITNVPQAIHRTALDLSGRKMEIGDRDRMTLGPIAGGAVKITPDVMVTDAIGIGEGIETALSLQRLPEWAGSPVWSVLNARGIKTFPVLADIGTLVVAVDHDEAGELAAREVTARWHAEGREVLLFEATATDADLNDVITKDCSHG